MSGAQNRSKDFLLSLVAAALVVAVVLLVVSLQRHLPSGGQAPAAASEPTRSSGEPTEPDPNEDINSLPTPSTSVRPADKSTIKPPEGEGHTFDPQKDFETGILDDDGAPTSSINFAATNYWNGFVGETPISVYGGYAGYEHPNDGAVFVVVVTPSGGMSGGGMQVLRGVGALTVVEGTNNGSVVLVNERGQEFEYGLQSRELKPIA